MNMMLSLDLERFAKAGAYGAEFRKTVFRSIEACSQTRKAGGVLESVKLKLLKPDMSQKRLSMESFLRAKVCTGLMRTCASRLQSSEAIQLNMHAKEIPALPIRL